ncbi:ficolin-3-like [Uranotaenia lowii]|uniref:ficolin-3-like n=1 Tax=Uranotaenia lowii TaxID=190385 RepID=UPI00247941EB|nr:ficolin-3-like [Uranotaenia lowii]
MVRVWAICMAALALTFERVSATTSSAQQQVGSNSSRNGVDDGMGGFDYQKLLAKLEILDTKLTRAEATAREQFSTLDGKLDKLLQQVDLINRSVRFVQRDVAGVSDQIQLFQNRTNEQLVSLTSSVTIVQSLLAVEVEGRRQRTKQQKQQLLTDEVKGEGREGTVVDNYSNAISKIYDGCDAAPRNLSQITRLQPEPGFGDVFSVLCDQEYDTGGWIVIQNRFNGAVDFYRGWKEYKNGFGNLNGEFWLGLDKLHTLTYSAPYEIHVLLEDFENTTAIAKYSRFAIGNEHESYALTKLGNYSGNAGDGLGYHRGTKFSTMDANYDEPGSNGAVEWTGAWWYRVGHHSNLNGQYLRGKVDGSRYHGKGMTWNPFRGDDYSLKRSRILIRKIVN